LAQAGSSVEIVATCHAVRVPAAPHLGAGMIQSMNDGRFERLEMQAGLALVPKGARVLEMGAGSGLVGAVLARNCQPHSILSIEANPTLIPHINALYAANDLTGIISVRHAVVISQPDPPTEIEFNVRGNFLGSSLTPVAGKSRPVKVPVIAYSELLQTWPHDTIMMDIEGGELEFLRHADLSGIRLFIAEFHRDAYGREGLRECRQLLQGAGLHRDDTHSQGSVNVFRREAS
jgi:FkbM family methyltransferase